MKRCIISVPVDADTSILDTVMSTVMPGSREAEIIHYIDGPGIPHTWALIENPSIQQPEAPA